jgi:hypothetical protein
MAKYASRDLSRLAARAVREGRREGEDAEHMTENPYPAESPLHYYWGIGWYWGFHRLMTRRKWAVEAFSE